MDGENTNAYALRLDEYAQVNPEWQAAIMASRTLFPVSRSLRLGPDNDNEVKVVADYLKLAQSIWVTDTNLEPPAVSELVQHLRSCKKATKFIVYLDLIQSQQDAESAWNLLKVSFTPTVRQKKSK